jgi:hypothetical protein
MIVQFIDQSAGTPVYINPAYVVTVRPEPRNPDHSSIVKLRDGEALEVKGDHRQVADKLSKAEVSH